MAEGFEGDWFDEPQRSSVLEGHTGAVNVIAYDYWNLASGAEDNTIRVWDWKKGECVRTYQGHKGAVNTLQYGSTVLVSGSNDGTIRQWKWDVNAAEDPGKVVKKATREIKCEGSVLKLQFDAVKLVACDGGGKMSVWDFNTGQLHLQKELDAPMTAFKFDNTFLIVGDKVGTLYMVNVADMEVVATMPASKSGHMGAIRSVEFNEFNVVSSDENGLMHIWDIRVGGGDDVDFFTSQFRINDAVNGKCNLQFDGEKVVTGLQNDVCVWELKSGECMNIVEDHHSEVVRCVAYDNYSKTLASAGQDGKIKVAFFSESDLPDYPPPKPEATADAGGGGGGGDSGGKEGKKGKKGKKDKKDGCAVQ